ncbi:MAG: endolytic transglycosylase MltG [Stappiaceae bacterium]
MQEPTNGDDKQEQPAASVNNAMPRLNPKSPRQAIQPDPVPEPPSRSRHVRNPVVVFINFLMTITVLGVLIVGGVIYWGKQEFEKNGPLDKTTTVIIPNGSNLAGIAGILERGNVIDNSWIFQGAVQVYRNQSKLKAGEYQFEAGVPMRTVMDEIVSGKAVYHSVTLPEGWTSLQIVERVKADPILIGDLNEVPAEGTLMPETYTFTRGTSRSDIIQRMKDAHTKVLAESWENRRDDLPVKTPEEMLVLASLVEKETGKADERSRVASVFVNRLNKGMRLQSDPTILYGLYGGAAWTKPRTILRSELQKPNSYNTYQIPALPPGPIANVGRAALEAVANPSLTSDLYFVADGTGGHAFAKTYEDHKRNVQRWRDVEKNRVKAQETAEDAPTEEAPKTE